MMVRMRIGRALQDGQKVICEPLLLSAQAVS